MKSNCRLANHVGLATKAALVLFAGTLFYSSEAFILQPFGYSGPNGDGLAAGGFDNFWDATYTGFGNKTQDGANLTGGLGALTNDKIATKPWTAVSNLSGTGQYVAWYNTDPTLTFHFDDIKNLNKIEFNFDNSQSHGSELPIDIIVDGVSHTLTYPAAGGPVEEWITGLYYHSETVTIQLVQAPDTWLALNQVRFYGTPKSTTPSPAAFLSFAVAAMPAMRRRSRLNKHATRSTR